MRRLLALAVLLTTPALGQSSLTFAEIGNIFCAAIVSGDLASLEPVLSADLARLARDRDVAWHSGEAAPVQCMAVGARGTADIPETVLFMGFEGGKTASDRLILNWINGRLRIDDVAYDRGGTLRETLASSRGEG